jgi:hypothetical protein
MEGVDLTMICVGSPYVAKAGLKLSLLSAAGITGVYHHTWLHI